ncbi:MAG: MoaD/ThiS family protein [Candidatus Xenobia bacterium]
MSTKLNVPTPLRSYTDSAGVVTASGRTVAELLADLERQFPGMRFRMIDEQERIRQHIRLFVNENLVSDLSQAIAPRDQFTIICAISGG